MVTKKIVIGGSLTTLIALLIYLSTLQGVIITTSGNIRCEGTLTNPCVSYFNITSNYYTLKFFNTSNQKLSFTPDTKNYTMYRYLNKKWTETKFPINMTKGVNYQFKLIGYKYNPTDTIKWGIKSGDANVDPYWLGEKKETVTYTYNTETHCISNICMAYIGWSYAYDTDGKWKLVDNATSLKNSSVTCNVNSDGINIVDCLDWNTTYITVNISMNNTFNFTSANFTNVPITVYSPNITNVSKLTGDFRKDYIVTNLPNTSFQTDAKGKIIPQTKVIPFKPGDILGIGSDQTTITLNESNSGNVGDAMVADNVKTYNTGSYVYHYISQAATNSGNRRTFILWNLSSIPSGSTITNANMSLYIHGTLGTVPINGVAYNTSLYNSTGAGPWVEGTLGYGDCGTSCALTQNITWNNQPSAGTLQSNVSMGSSTSVRIYWNVTNAAISTFANISNKNMSIMIKSALEGGTSGGYFLESKEQTANRPQLVITYTTGGVTYPQITIQSPTNTTYASNNIWANVTLNEAGSWCGVNNDSNSVNLTMSNTTGNWNYDFNSPNPTKGSHIFVFYCNDSTGGMNSTNISFTIDNTPPQYSNVGTNNTNPLPLAQVLYYSNWTDNVALSHWIFSWNGTGLTCGTWANDTAVAFSGSWANVTHQVPLACAGQIVDYEFYANDTSNNWNSTTMNAFTEGNIYNATFNLSLSISTNQLQGIKQLRYFNPIVNIVTQQFKGISLSNLFNMKISIATNQFRSFKLIEFFNIYPNIQTQFLSKISLNRFSNINMNIMIQYFRGIKLLNFFNINPSISTNFFRGINLYNTFNINPNIATNYFRNIRLNVFFSNNINIITNYFRIFKLIDFFNNNINIVAQMFRGINLFNVLNIITNIATNQFRNINFVKIFSLNLNVITQQLQNINIIRISSFSIQLTNNFSRMFNLNRISQFALNIATSFINTYDGMRSFIINIDIQTQFNRGINLQSYFTQGINTITTFIREFKAFAIPDRIFNVMIDITNNMYRMLGGGIAPTPFDKIGCFVKCLISLNNKKGCLKLCQMIQ
jgi:hypothetical protein